MSKRLQSLIEMYFKNVSIFYIGYKFVSINEYLILNDVNLFYNC